MKQKILFSAWLIASGAIASVATAAGDIQTEGATVGEWTMDFAAAKELAEEKQLPLFLDFTGSDWCGWCKLMQREVFAKEAWQDYAEDNLVLVTIDFPRDKSTVPEKYRERNDKLKEKYGVRGYPTYIILGPNGEEQIGQLGASREATPEMFIDQVEETLLLSDMSIKQYVEAHPDQAKAYKAAIADYRKAQEELKSWLETRPDETEANREKLQQHISQIEEARAAIDDLRKKS